MAASGTSPSPSGEGLAPRAIRSRLILEDAGQFDREYRRLMSDATESLDLNPVLDMLRRWERVARMTEHDPKAYRRMLRTAAALNAGEDVPTVPWEETKRRLGL